jgi:hypothetical protein
LPDASPVCGLPTSLPSALFLPRTRRLHFLLELLRLLLVFLLQLLRLLLVLLLHLLLPVFVGVLLR